MVGSTKPTFIDLFSGCGGLSLGLVEAGWEGVFAIEKDPMAFQTLKHNLIEQRRSFAWPDWLEQKSIPITKLLTNHKKRLADLKGRVDLIAGGPPCQGFSHAGRRNKDDPRNRLTNQYIKVVELVAPRFLLLENVRGFDSPFASSARRHRKRTYAQYVKERLTQLGYVVFTDYLLSSDFGVPQHRKRFILIAIKNGDPALKELDGCTPFFNLYKLRASFLRTKGLNPDKRVSVSEAISDLRVTGRRLVPCADSNVDGFFQIAYRLPSQLSPYKKLMRRGMLNGTAPSDMRLPKHHNSTIQRFEIMIASAERGKCLSAAIRRQLGLKKRALTPLAPYTPAATITTLPDDMVHYAEPRILTVRENARLQSFPDWFSFKGNYTTGGVKRKTECPRYTQVGNAVPPLLGEVLGVLLVQLRAAKPTGLS